MARKEFSAKVKRVLGNWSSNTCMLCRKPLVTPNYAHIVPASENGPRSELRGRFDDSFIKSSENGLCLCNDCHTEIDDSSLNSYTADELFQTNKRFQNDYDIQEEYKQALGVYHNNTYNELIIAYEQILNYLNQELDPLRDYIPKLSFDKVPYEEKMEINKFNRRHKNDITHVYAEEFSAFQKMVEDYPVVGIKLRAAVSLLYQRLRKEEKNENEILEKMLNVMYDPTNKVLGNKITLYYYFIICEVFSK